MIEITPTAQDQIRSLLDDESRAGMLLRMQILGRGPGGFRYAVRFTPPDEIQPDDEVVDFEGFQVLIDPATLPDISGSTLDFKEDTFQRGFLIENPNPVWRDSTAQAIQDLLDNKINPGVASHGGFVSLVDFKDETAYIAFGGGCQGCGMIDVTLKQGVEVMIKEAIPQVKEIVDTTDHSRGSNPYFNEQGGRSALS
jgi:Fe/S biogenesis protein NfuA